MSVVIVLSFASFLLIFQRFVEIPIYKITCSLNRAVDVCGQKERSTKK